MEVSMYDKLLLLPLFQGLGKEDFTAILEKVKLHFQKYAKGSCIVRQNDICNNLIFILQGWISSDSADNEHHYVLKERFEAPCVIEPYSLFGMQPQYTASYYALNDINAVIVNKSYILSELSKYEIFQLNYFNLLSNRAQTVYRKLWNAHIGNTYEKIVNFLQLRCTNPAGEKELLIRMEDLASLIDDTRINVSKVLNELKDLNLIQLSRKEIHIPALEKLADYIKEK
ncbi:Crp/Fnr family transcriptional regulator [uncultured Bacteroides sp.]|uniref:Crp/Fnr family transcriptional regulator n=1 Tax=uncultured Bacteroides sp. TaxID=162156 RepID=UPI002631EF8D|nr:Crp/Fnr family transcriptional regulator [uncultured Bacteroides sp.]